MARALRVQYKGALYHVMNRGTNRLPTFLSADNKHLFLRVLADTVNAWKIRVHAFCLMNNHYHLLIETPLANLSRAMRHIDGVYTQRLNRELGRDGSLFRGRFKSIIVERETYFLALVRYIHLNAVKAGLHTRAGDDPFCSHPAYLNPASRPSWLTVSDVLQRFGGDTLKGRTLFDQFVHAPVGQALQEKLDKNTWPAILGGKRFIGQIRGLLSSKTSASPDVPQEKEILRLATVEEVSGVVAEAYGLQWEVVKGPSSITTREARIATMCLMREFCQLTYAQIGEIFGGIRYSTVATLLRRNQIDSARYRSVRLALMNESCSKSKT